MTETPLQPQLVQLTNVQFITAMALLMPEQLMEVGEEGHVRPATPQEKITRAMTVFAMVLYQEACGAIEAAIRNAQEQGRTAKSTAGGPPSGTGGPSRLIQ
jgi:hypothetical protein